MPLKTMMKWKLSLHKFRETRTYKLKVMRRKNTRSIKKRLKMSKTKLKTAERILVPSKLKMGPLLIRINFWYQRMKKMLIPRSLCRRKFILKSLSGMTCSVTTNKIWRRRGIHRGRPTSTCSMDKVQIWTSLTKFLARSNPCKISPIWVSAIKVLEPILHLANLCLSIPRLATASHLKSNFSRVQNQTLSLIWKTSTLLQPETLQNQRKESKWRSDMNNFSRKKKNW